MVSTLILRSSSSSDLSQSEAMYFWELRILSHVYRFTSINDSHTEAYLHFYYHYYYFLSSYLINWEISLQLTDTWKWICVVNQCIRCLLFLVPIRIYCSGLTWSRALLFSFRFLMQYHWNNALQLSSWRKTYTGLMPYLYFHSADRFTPFFFSKSTNAMSTRLL